MLAYLCSYFPYYSVMMFPIFACVKPKEKFLLTKEAKKAIENVKGVLSEKMILYNPKPDLPFYLDCDSSNVAFGACLYQIQVLDKTEKNLKRCLDDYGYIPEQNVQTLNMIPGMSYGKQVPIVKTFLSTRIEQLRN